MAATRDWTVSVVGVNVPVQHFGNRKDADAHARALAEKHHAVAGVYEMVAAFGASDPSITEHAVENPKPKP